MRTILNKPSHIIILGQGKGGVSLILLIKAIEQHFHNLKTITLGLHYIISHMKEISMRVLALNKLTSQGKASCGMNRHLYKYKYCVYVVIKQIIFIT